MFALKIVTVSLNGLLSATYVGIATLLTIGLVQRRARGFNALGLMLALVTLTSGLTYLAQALIIGLRPWGPEKVTYTALAAVSLVPALILLTLWRRYEDLLGGVRLLTETRRQLHERSAQLSALVDLGAHLSHLHNLPQVLASALERCLALSRFEAGLFYLRLEESFPLTLHTHAHLPPEILAHLASAEAVPHEPWLAESPLQVRPVESAPGPGTTVLRQAGWHHLLDLPVRGAEGSLGVIRLLSRRAPALKQEQLNLLEAMGQLTGVVIDSVRFLEVQTRFRQELQQQVAQATAELRDTNTALAAEQRRLQTLVDHMPNGLLMLDGEGRIAMVNQQAEALLGVTRYELLGRPLPDSGLPVELVASLSASQPPEAERYDVSLATPTPRALQVHAAPVIDGQGKRLGLVYVFHDVTREREIDQMKTDFVSLVSHELRTPLTSIIGFAALLLEGEIGPLNATQRRSLTAVHRQAKRLAALISNLLDVSRIEAGQVSLRQEPVDLEAMAQAVLQELQPQARAKNLAMDLVAPPDLPVVRGDPERLTQVLSNLVGNAVKFTPPGGRVELTLDGEEGELKIRVRDTGPGIPLADQPRIFDKFYQVERVATRKSGGTGLGLAIVKGIVEAHGGRIEVESTPGQGASFTVSLPARARAAAAAPAAPLVLVIERDAEAAHTLETRLQRQGYRVLVVNQLDQALFQANAIGPDAILYAAAEGNGNLLAQLQQDPRTRAIPVLELPAAEPVEARLAELCPLQAGQEKENGDTHSGR